MANSKQSMHGQWSGKYAFILAAAGSAVGLGNIWKFPYITGENGGGAFVLVYLVCIVVVGIPIMMTEILLGRRGRSTPINTMRQLAMEASAHPAWKYLGWLGMIAGFLILSYYSVIAGWALAYILKAGTSAFDGATPASVRAIFAEFLASPVELLFWHTLFMMMTMAVVARGVKNGLEKAVRFLMPALLVLLLILVGYALNSGAFAEGFEFLFSPDFSKLTGNGVLIAMGHAFFTLSLGMGAIMIYGAYLPQNTSIAQATFFIAGADTVVALLAGLAIFPIVFANGLEPSAGPGLIFQTLPIAFGQMPGGVIVGTLFFVLLLFAAWSSSISLIEPGVTWLVEEKGFTRISACVWSGVVTWALGIGTVLSFNAISDLTIFDKTFFDILDYLTANIMLPLGGLLMALFVGWVLPNIIVRDELSINNPAIYKAWFSIVKYVTPLIVVIIFLRAIGLI